MAGQLVRATGSSGTLGYENDRGGRLVRQHDEATGETVTYAYDKAGRRILMAVKHGDEIVDGTKDSARIIKNARQRAVRNAWKQEKEMVEITGQGTRRWTKSELKELVETGKVKGYQGHHINNVKDHPEMAGNPNNVEFLNKTEHLEAHGGNYRNMTEGPLLNRSVE